MTKLHITKNEGQGSEILCGAARRQTYRTVEDGLSDRYINATFFEPGIHGKDPELCSACLNLLAEAPRTFPAWWNA